MTAARICVATPFDGGDLRSAMVTLGYVEFREALIRHLDARTLWGTTLFAADVVRARNRAAATVLREKAFADVTHVLWLDSDNFPEDPIAGVAMVVAMVATGEDMIAAPYVRKKEPTSWVHQGTFAEPDARGVACAFSVGFGFTLTSVECLRRVSGLADGYVDLLGEGQPRHHVANIFGQVMIDAGDGERSLASEDVSFCARWRDLGGRVTVYAGGCLVEHAGSKRYSARDLKGAVR